MNTKRKILSYALSSIVIVGALAIFGASENAQNLQGSYIIQENSEIPEMTYVPGEIIIKFAENSGNIGSTSFSSYNDPSNPFLPANKELLKNATSKAAISQNVSRATPPPNSVKSSSYGIIKAQRQLAADVAQEAGLDRIYFYEFADLKKKAEEFHQKVFEEMKNKGMSYGTLQIQTPEYGLIRVNVPRSGNFVDPYTAQIVQILANHPDVEYAEINKRIKFSEDWDWGEKVVTISNDQGSMINEEEIENGELGMENGENSYESENVETPYMGVFEGSEQEEKIQETETVETQNFASPETMPDEYSILHIKETYPIDETKEYKTFPIEENKITLAPLVKGEQNGLEESPLDKGDLGDSRNSEGTADYLSPEEIELLRREIMERENGLGDSSVETSIHGVSNTEKNQETETVETPYMGVFEEEKPSRFSKENIITEGMSPLNEEIMEPVNSIQDSGFRIQNSKISPTDPLFSQQWNFDSPLNNDINLPEAFGNPNYKKGEGIIVAVIDSGLDYTHEDIDDNIWIQQDEVPVSFFPEIDADHNEEITSREILHFFEEQNLDINGDSVIDFRDVLHQDSPLMDNVDNDGNGYVDDLMGWDFYGYETNEDGGWDSGRDNNPFDINGHGTHVTGIIAAEENDHGMVGVAPRAKIMSIRGIGAQGGGDLSGIISGIYYAIENGADVMNNSWGGIGGSNAVKNAMEAAEQAGIYVVAASGNNNSDVMTFFPANIESTVSVGSHGPSGERSFFGNYGAHLDVSAPGENILSLGKENSYAVLSGTSSAAPHVSGIIAGVLSSVSNKPPPENIRYLLRTGTQVEPWNYFSTDLGYGKIDLSKTFHAADVPRINPKILEPLQNGKISFGDKIYVDISLYENKKIDLRGQGILEKNISLDTAEKSSMKNSDLRGRFLITANALSSNDQKSVEICSGYLPYTPCEIDTLTNFYREHDTFLLEFIAFDENKNVIGRDAVQVFLNDISLEIQNPGIMVYGSNVTIPVRFLIATGEEFSYDIFARPLSHEGQKISIRNGKGQGHIDEDLTFNTQHLPVSGKYEIVLEVIAGGKTVTKQKEIFVDLGLEKGFPIVDTTTNMSTEFFPIQILDINKNIPGKEIYSPKNNCKRTDSGYPSCRAEKIVRFGGAGNVEDVSKEFFVGQDIETQDIASLHTKNFLASAGNSQFLALTYSEYSEDDLGHSARENGKIRILSQTENRDPLLEEIELDAPLSEWHDKKNIAIDDLNEDGKKEIIVRTQGWESPCVDNSEQFLNIFFANPSENPDGEGFENGKINTHYNGANILKFPITSPGENAFFMGMSVANFSAEHEGKEIAIVHRIDSCAGKTEEYRIDIFSPLDKGGLGDFENTQQTGDHDPLLKQIIFSPENGAPEYSPFAVDIEGDGIFEIVLPRIKTGEKFTLFADVYSGDGEKLQEIQIAENEVSYPPTFAYTDINEDGKIDILTGFGSHFSASSLADGNMLFARTITGNYQKESRLLASKIFVIDLEKNSLDKGGKGDFNNSKEILLFTSDQTAQGEQDLSLRMFDKTGKEIKNSHFPKLFPSTVTRGKEKLFVFPIPESMRIAHLSSFDKEDLGDPSNDIHFLFQSILENGKEHTLVMSDLGKGNIFFDGNERGNEEQNGRIAVVDIDINSKVSQAQEEENGDIEIKNLTSKASENEEDTFLEANFTALSDGLTVIFTNTSDENFTSFSWNFGDENISEEKNPTYTYVESGNYEVTLIAKNESEEKEVKKNISLTMKNTPPEIILEGERRIFLNKGEAFVEPGYTATDAEDGDITNTVEIEGTVDTNRIGSYYIKYTVIDSAGAKEKTSRTIKVQEKTEENISSGSTSTEEECIRPVVSEFFPERNATISDLKNLHFMVSDNTDIDDIFIQIDDQKQDYRVQKKGEQFFVQVDIDESLNIPGQKRVVFSAVSGKNCERALSYYIHILPEQGSIPYQESNASNEVGIASNTSVPSLSEERVHNSAALERPKSGIIYANNFIDTEGHWSDEFVQKLLSEGLVQIQQDGKFYPDTEAKRAEILKIIIEASVPQEEIETCLEKNTNPDWTYVFFPDVPKDSWYAKYACVAKIKGIVNGFSNGTFGPEKQITRAEVLKIMLIAQGGNINAEGNIFVDVTENDWFAPFVLHATREGIVKGYDRENGKFFLPYNPVTRAEASKMVVNVFGL